MRHSKINQSRALFSPFALVSLTRFMIVSASLGYALGCTDSDNDDDGDGGRGGTAAATTGGSAGNTNGGKGGAAGGSGGGAGRGGASGDGGSGMSAGEGGATAESGAGGQGAAGEAAGEGGDSGSAGAVDPAFEVEGDRRIPYTATSDIAFTDYFIAHHEMAIEMAEHVVARGSDATVVAMAQELIETQRAEVMRLEAIRDESSGSVPPMPSDPHSDAEMEHMSELSGADLDAMFLLDMIPHHASALPVAHRSVEHLENSELADMARAIEDAQATEIGEMRMMLEQLGVQSAGEDMAQSSSDRPDFGLVGDRRIPLTPDDDVTFIDFFVPHHQMAVMMADHAIARGEDPEVIAMATQMKTTQTAEIATMQSKREALAGSSDSPAVPPDPHMEAEMAEMAQASGAEVDRLFLEGMIVHHAAALPTAHRARPHVTDADLSALANTMYLEQAQEIGEMKAMLEAM